MHASLNHLFIRMIFYINMIFTITVTHFEHMDKGSWLYMNTQININIPSVNRLRSFLPFGSFGSYGCRSGHLCNSGHLGHLGHSGHLDIRTYGSALQTNILVQRAPPRVAVVTSFTKFRVKPNTDLSVFTLTN